MEFLKTVYDNTDPWAVIIFSLLFGLFIVLATGGVIHHKDDENNAMEITAIWLKRAFLIIIFVAFPFFSFLLYVIAVYNFGHSFAADYMGSWFSIIKSSFAELWIKALPLLFIPLFMKLFIKRVVVPKISHLKRKWSVLQTGDSPSDIRVEVDKLKAKKFNPRDYYQKDKHFYGLDKNENPIYDPLDKYVKTHIKVLGPSQTGKGVTLGVKIDQAIWRGWGVWFFDRKPDDFIPDIMRESCDINNRSNEFVICDLTGIGPSGYHPLLNGTDREVRTRAMNLFSLHDDGTNADHYKMNARAAFDLVFPYWDRTLSHLKELLTFPPSVLSKAEQEAITTFGKKIVTSVNELLQLKHFNPSDKGFNVEECLTQGKVVYIRTSMEDRVIRAVEQNMLHEMLQVCARGSLSNYVEANVDEARFAMTETLADSLATSLSKLLLLTLAYQSINDPKNLTDKTLNADSIKNGIETNTQTTIAHRANDEETATWLAELTGKIQKTVTKMERVERNNAGAEEWTGERSVGHLEENFISTNTLLALPPMVSILIRPNELATVLYTCFIPVKEFLIKNGQYPTQSNTSQLKQDVAQPIAIKTDDTTSRLVIEQNLIGEDPFAMVDDDNSFDQEPSSDLLGLPSVTHTEPDQPIINQEKLAEIEDLAGELLSGLNIDKEDQNTKKEVKKQNVVKRSNGSKKQNVVSNKTETSNKPNDNVDLSSLDTIEGI